MKMVCESDAEHLLRRCRDGDDAAFGELLQVFRSYLTLLARLQVGVKLQGKADPSDLVQETFLQAHRSFGQFRGTTEQELLGWLRQILASRVAKMVRHYLGTHRRDARLEQQLCADLDRSSQALDKGLLDTMSSPSQRASRREQAVILADAIERLSPEYREIIVLHHLQSLSLSEVARRLGQSRTQTERLWIRALADLHRFIKGN